MLPRRAVPASAAAGSRFYCTHGLKVVPTLHDGTIQRFREEAFIPAVPVLLPRKHFEAVPAIHKWFLQNDCGAKLNISYLSEFGSTSVPLEISYKEHFSRTEHTLSFFLDALSSSSAGLQIYLAQAPIPDLHQELKDDVPTPELVLEAGKGDVYDSSIWLGNSPTYTPLHRDPNPNLFVQLAGKKVVRLFPPHVGRSIFAKVQEQIGGSASETMRGEEMMQGAEKKALEVEVWKSADGGEARNAALEAEMGSGDGLFIPKGWWHSVKSFGEGMTGSVNWWFR